MAPNTLHPPGKIPGCVPPDLLLPVGSAGRRFSVEVGIVERPGEPVEIEADAGFLRIDGRKILVGPDLIGEPQRVPWLQRDRA